MRCSATWNRYSLAPTAISCVCASTLRIWTASKSSSPTSFAASSLPSWGVGLAIVSSVIYMRVGSLIVLLAGLVVSSIMVGLVFLLPNPQRYPFRMRRARRTGREG